jgi:uncharacterized protein
VRYVIAGSSGFLGAALRARLADSGHEVVRLVRRPAQSASESTWDPYAGSVDRDVVASADVVVNLAGAPYVHWPWTRSYKRQLRESRLRTTDTLARAIADSAPTPVFVVASGVTRYGVDRGDEVLTEDSRDGDGAFLAAVVRAWEAAADPARAAGARVIHVRTGAAIDRSGATVKAMWLPFWLGIAGRVGSGRQYFPVISLTDWLRAFDFLVEHDDAEGAYNFTGPNPPTNAEFTRALAAAMHRPAVMWAPAFAIRAALGGLADVVLGSLRALPKRLVDAGFEHEHRDVDAIVAAGLRR